MADPVITPCQDGVITKVATNVTAVTLRVILNTPKKYSWSYLATGSSAPADTADFVPLKDGEALNFGAAADLYVFADGGDGSIRADT